MTTRFGWCLLLLVFGVLGVAQEATIPGSPEWALRMGFETAVEQRLPHGWQANPRETVGVDTTVFRSGAASLRIRRGLGTAGSVFSNASTSLPIDFGGRTVELRGYLKREQVDGWCGLWLRADGPEGMISIDNMAARQTAGTADWAEFSVRVELTPAVRRLVFGALLHGSGTLWVDDLRLLVDGKPVEDAPKVIRATTVLDTDREFDRGSRISLPNLSPTQLEALVKLGEVWAFLKYHHPRATAGELQWDFELFRVLPSIVSAGSETEVNAALVRWIEKLGALPEPATTRSSGGDVHLREETAWLADENRWGARLSTQLKEVFASRSADSRQFYVSFRPAVGNPDFAHERSYPEIAATDDGYRLLALFRYWGIIRYWFPYRDLIEEDWHAVLAEFLPRLLNARNADEYARQMLLLIARVHDTHANLWSSLRVRPPVGNYTIPACFRFVEDKLVVTDVAGPAANSGLRAGDVVQAIDGRAVEELVRDWSPYYAASNVPTRLRDIAMAAGNGPAGDAVLMVQRDGATREVTVGRVPLSAVRKPEWRRHDLPGAAFQMLSADVAYLKLSAVKAEELASYADQIAGRRGLIIDARNYPSAFLLFALGSGLVRERTTFACFTQADPGTPGRFYFRPGQPIVPRGSVFAGRVVVLVDEVTQSSAEYHAMAFRAVPGAKVLGSTTAGADGNASKIPLPGGLETMISGIGVFYSDKRPTQRIGIVPDMEVRPTIAGVRAGRDEVLEAALREILGAEVSDEAIRGLVPRRH